MFLLKRDQYTDAIATEMTAKYLSFVDLTPDHQCNAYRGFRTDLAGLNTVLREGLVQSRKFHFMVSFAKELDIAVYYSFRPHQCSIQPDQKALAVLVQIDVSKAQAAGIRITEEHTMKRVWDVWGNIPPQHLKRIFVFDVIAHKFVEIKSADQRF